MSVDFNTTPLNTSSTSETETPMFAPIPSWERNRKRKGFGGKSRAAATVQVGTPVSDARREADIAPRNAADSAFATAPAFATRPVKKGRTGLPMAVAAGIVAIGGLAAAGWYASQPHDTGMAKLTPGTESTALPATAPVMAANAATPTLPVEVKATAAMPARATTRVAAAAPARARTAVASRSAGDAGVNTAATLPSAPQPYSGTATAPAAPADVAPVTAAPAWNLPPKAAAPAPAPVEAAPAPVTATLPSQTPPN